MKAACIIRENPNVTRLAGLSLDRVNVEADRGDSVGSTATADFLNIADDMARI